MVNAARVAQRYFADRYARLLLAMSMGEAKSILGFPPGASPSEQEVSKAYKSKAFENHPDRGGDASKMVEINVAKDILQGKQSPTGPGGRRQRRPSGPPGGWTDEDRVPKDKPKPPPPVDGASFSQAMGSIPGGIDWKFVSTVAYASDLKRIDGDAYWRYYYGWVAYGQTESHHVFAGIRVETAKQAMRGDGAWEAFHVGAPRKLNLIRLAPKMVKQIMAGLTGLEGSMDNKYMVPKKYKVLDGTLSESILKAGGAGLRLKDAIIGSGSMPAGSAGLKGRKAQITIEPVWNQGKYKDWKAENGRMMGGDAHNAYDWFVEVNGKGRQLKDEEVERLAKSHFLAGVFSYEYKRKKNITRMRGGRMSAGAAEATQLLGESLNTGGLKDQVMEAAAAYTKQADMYASMPLLDIALLEGKPLMTVYSEALSA